MRRPWYRPPWKPPSWGPRIVKCHSRILDSRGAAQKSVMDSSFCSSASSLRRRFTADDLDVTDEDELVEGEDGGFIFGVFVEL